MLKKHVLFILCLFTLNTFAQTPVLTQEEGEVIGTELEKKGDEQNHPRAKEMFQKVAGKIKGSLKVDCQDCSQKEKRKKFWTKVGRNLGKASIWVTTKTTKPFLYGASFLTGFFERPDKNADVVGLYQFLLNHEEDFAAVLETNTLDDTQDVVSEAVEEILLVKKDIIIRDFLTNVLKMQVPEDLSELDLTDVEIDMEKVKVDFVNNHPEYQELIPIVGLMTQQQFEELIIYGYYAPVLDIESFKRALPRYHELGAAVVSQVIVPKLILSSISGVLGGIYLVPVLLADIGTAISVGVCMKPGTQEKFVTDPDLDAFCSYAINKSAYELFKSRAKGYIAGKNLRLKLKAKFDKMKQKRLEKKKLREEKKRLQA